MRFAYEVPIFLLLEHQSQVVWHVLQKLPSHPCLFLRIGSSESLNWRRTRLFVPGRFGWLLIRCNIFERPLMAVNILKGGTVEDNVLIHESLKVAKTSRAWPLGFDAGPSLQSQQYRPSLRGSSWWLLVDVPKGIFHHSRARISPGLLRRTRPACPRTCAFCTHAIAVVKVVDMLGERVLQHGLLKMQLGASCSPLHPTHVPACVMLVKPDWIRLLAKVGKVGETA